MLRCEAYTGGEHYWTRFHNGTHEVRREAPEHCEDNETVFTGFYEECVRYIEKIKKDNTDYDLNL